MSNDPNVYEYDPERAAASAKRIHEEARKLGLTNPAEAIYAPDAKVRILSKGTPEWEERQKRDEQWRIDNPRPKPPPVHYHIQKDGTWEQRFATEEQLAERRKAEDVPLHSFKVVFDQNSRRWGLKQGLMTKFFSSSDAVIIHCRRASKGERSVVEFYKAPRPIDEWLGDDFGDFINSESW